MGVFGGISAIFGIGKEVIDRVVPDKNAAAAAKAQLAEDTLKGEYNTIAEQLEVNKAEAASNSIFVAGWRPAVGWVCALGVAMDVIIRPMFNWLAALFGHPMNFPALDMSTLIPLLVGMLGLGTLRTIDKTQGTDNGH